MPTMRCNDPECGHQWYRRAPSAAGEDCTCCGGESTVLRGYEEPDAQAPKSGSKPLTARAIEADIRKRAREVLRDAQITKPPIPVPALVRQRGMSVEEVEPDALGGLSGILIDNHIQVPRGQPLVRRRFVLAHELGHCVLGTSHESDQYAERDANKFANELLVPGHMLEAAMVQQTDRLALCRLFQVSAEVLSYAADYHHLTRKLTGS